MDNTINSLVSQAVGGVSDQQIRDFLAANPTPDQLASAMAQYNVSPEQVFNAAGVGQGGTLNVGGTIYQPEYQVLGSGEDQQIGPLQNIYSYQADQNKVGGSYNQYDPTGQLVRQGTQQAVNPTADFLKFAALTGAGLYGLGAFDGLGGAAATEGTTLGSLGNAGANYGLGSDVAGMGGAQGITGGYSGLGINPGTAGLGAEGLGAGITAGSGLTGTGVLSGSTLGEGLLGASALNNLTGTGVLTGSNLGTSLLGTGANTGLTGTGILSGSNLGKGLLGTGVGSALTGGVTGLGGTTLGTGALNTGVGTVGGTSGLLGSGTGLTTGGTGTKIDGSTGTLLNTGTGLSLSALGNTLGSLANQSGISDARNLINQYGTQAGNALTNAYQNAQNLNAANRSDLANIYGNTTGNLQNLYNQQVGYQQPYQDIGNQGATGLAANKDYLTHQFDKNDLNAQLAPNYEFMLNQGQMANQRAANLGGGALGGNALQGLQKYTQDYAGNAYQQAFNNYNTQRNNIYNSLAGMAGIGQTSAGQLAGLGSNYGSNLAGLSSNYGGNLTTGYGQGIGAANAYGLNQAGLATGIGSALASNATQQGANTAGLLGNLGNTALLGSLLKLA